MLPTIKDILDVIKEDEKSGMFCLTREDAVKKAWWIMHDAIEKEVKEHKRKVLVNNEWVEPTDEFNAIVDGIHENLSRKEVKDADNKSRSE